MILNKFRTFRDAEFWEGPESRFGASGPLVGFGQGFRALGFRVKGF